MLACVLNSPTAVAASLRVVDAFVRLRELVAERDGLGRKLEDLIEKPPPRRPRKIGFR